jgi:hypothetical protein
MVEVCPRPGVGRVAEFAIVGARYVAEGLGSGPGSVVAGDASLRDTDVIKAAAFPVVGRVAGLTIVGAG